MIIIGICWDNGNFHSSPRYYSNFEFYEIQKIIHFLLGQFFMLQMQCKCTADAARIGFGLWKFKIVENWCDIYNNSYPLSRCICIILYHINILTIVSLIIKLSIINAIIIAIVYTFIVGYSFLCIFLIIHRFFPQRFNISLLSLFIIPCNDYAKANNMYIKFTPEIFVFWSI